MTPTRAPITNETTQETRIIMAVVVPIPWIVLSLSLPELPMDDEKWLVKSQKSFLNKNEQM